MKFDTQGRELPDPTPIEIPAGFQRPATLQEQIERCFRNVVSRNAQARGHETFEEANDFDIDDDDPTEATTKYTDMIPEVGDGQGADATHGSGRPGAPPKPPGDDRRSGAAGEAEGGADDADVDSGPGSGDGGQRGQSGEDDLGADRRDREVRKQAPQDRRTGAGAARKPVI